MRMKTVGGEEEEKFEKGHQVYLGQKRKQKKGGKKGACEGGNL